LGNTHQLNILLLSFGFYLIVKQKGYRCHRG